MGITFKSAKHYGRKTKAEEAAEFARLHELTPETPYDTITRLQEQNALLRQLLTKSRLEYAKLLQAHGLPLPNAEAA